MVNMDTKLDTWKNKLLDMGMGQFMDHSRQDDMPFE